MAPYDLHEDADGFWLELEDGTPRRLGRTVTDAQRVYADVLARILDIGLNPDAVLAAQHTFVSRLASMLLPPAPVPTGRVRSTWNVQIVIGTRPLGPAPIRATVGLGRFQDLDAEDI